ncbi:hypothetical protein GIB67_026039 [Kingdonia uniflora]|uniref:Hyccin n=1 Tax=Kingdonia uniflora TaxID=39325 RepID=A0A7J7M2T5_9MAGN|nr:hypothetical protein GIB67_026039 [Kingdonia uniflora]
MSLAEEEYDGTDDELEFESDEDEVATTSARVGFKCRLVLVKLREMYLIRIEEEEEEDINESLTDYSDDDVIDAIKMEILSNQAEIDELQEAESLGSRVDRPARSLLESHEAYLSLSHSLSNPLSGSGDDPLCQWFYETFQSSDPDLRLVVLAFVPLITGLYLSRIINPNTSSNPNSLLTPSLSGFESVILSIYASEYKSRGGKPVLITMPDLSQPSLYHYPKGRVSSGVVSRLKPDVGVLCPPLEQQVGVKSTKRSFIVSVVLDCYYKQISQMPSWSKLELCEFVVKWAGKSCPCRSEFDSVGDNVLEIKDFEDDYKHEIEDGVVEEMSKFEIGEDSKVTSTRIPLPWELLQPVLRILGHCLLAPLISQDVKDAASVAVRCLYARASHELVPQAILATRSLIHLDKRGRAAAKAEADAITASNANTPIKGKPQNFLVSK